jgi:TetR/AcrR family transcriptional repressor of mexJK operon
MRTPPSPDTTQGARGDRRSDLKRAAILAAATTTFLRRGYLGTSMDEIAALAGVSKQTVYKHFADKERLFKAMVVGTVDEASGPVYQEVLDLDATQDLESALRRLARRQLGLVMQPRLLQLRRLVIGEAGRFPELGRVFYEQGPQRTIDALAATFERLAERHLLEFEDAHLAAAHFNWLVMSIPLNEAMLCGTDEALAPADVARYADAGVGAFLAAYGRR